MSSLPTCYSRELYPFKNSPQKAGVQIGLAFAQRHFPDVVDDCNLPHVVVRVSPVLSKIAGVAGKGTIALCRVDGVGSIIDAVRPSVGALQLEPMAQPARNLQLQCVVDGVAH